MNNQELTKIDIWLHNHFSVPNINLSDQLKHDDVVYVGNSQDQCFYNSLNINTSDNTAECSHFVVLKVRMNNSHKLDGDIIGTDVPAWCEANELGIPINYVTYVTLYNYHNHSIPISSVLDSILKLIYSTDKENQILGLTYLCNYDCNLIYPVFRTIMRYVDIDITEQAQIKESIYIWKTLHEKLATSQSQFSLEELFKKYQWEDRLFTILVNSEYIY